MLDNIDNRPTNDMDVIDSRDVIDSITNLKDWIDSEGDNEVRDQYMAELKALEALAKEAEPESSDWTYGETLIRRSYFVDYITDLIHECYELPKEFNSGNWPFRHMTFDYEAAAKEAEQDYASVYFDGVEYLIRSC